MVFIFYIIYYYEKVNKYYYLFVCNVRFEFL